MKRLKGLLVIALILVSASMLNYTKCFAAEVQYTDNVIPTMTSNTSPSGKASASSYLNSTSSYPAYLAFDHVNNTSASAWAATSGINTGWLAYEFSDAKCITKYTLSSRNPVYIITEMPKTWTFQAYNENTNTWVTLDTQTNITNWSVGVKKDFTFSNSNYYKNYRINITANGDSTHSLVIGEMEMMETVSTPVNLTASVGDSYINLSWNSVNNAISYNIKRSTTTGGPYVTIATSSAITFTDLDVEPGTTYYYVVSAIVSGTESSNSNEASATLTDEPTPPGHTGNTATLILTMTNGDDKGYNLSLTELDNFLTWYDSKSDGTGKAYYIFTKSESIAPYVSVKDYVSFDKISSFEVKEYNQ